MRYNFFLWLGENLHAAFVNLTKNGSEMTIVNPKIHQLTINFGEAAFRLKELGLPEVVFMKQVLKPEDLRDDEPVGVYNEPPWDREIEDF